MRQSIFRLPPIFTLSVRCMLSFASVALPAPTWGKAAAATDYSSNRAQLAETMTEHSFSPEGSIGKFDVEVEICDWYGGAAGAASISVDDSFPSCRDVLNRNGFKGTYYLSGTDKFTEADWDLWRAIHAEGHEIGCHTVSHCSCHILDEATLRWEFSTNKKDIMANLGLREEEVLSFAWPCGDASPGSKAVASEYFLCARGYHINELEDKVPTDFMYLKCLNTPHYHPPVYDPPNYFEKADEAERLGKWVHFVFHNECLDDGAIDYLGTKNLWVAPVGSVSKYIKERKNSRVMNQVDMDSKIAFTLECRLKPDLFNQPLTLRVGVDPTDVQTVLVNGISTAFTRLTDHILFDVRPSGNDEVMIPMVGFAGRADRGSPAPGQMHIGARSKPSRRLDARNGAVINIWISGQPRLDNLRNHRIKYLFVDVGDTNRDGKIETSITEIEQFLRMIKSYEKQHTYDFVLLPYSEIDTHRYQLDRTFRENFIADYTGLMALGFDGIYVDVEPVREALRKDYLEFLSELSAVCPETKILGVYAGSVSCAQGSEEETNEWQWSLSLYRDVSNFVDLIVVPGYDFDLRNRTEYMLSIRKQIDLLCSEPFNCQFTFAIPTHKREPETIDNALTAYDLEISRHPQHQFIGVCVFAEWTTIPEEWNALEAGK